MYRKETFCLTTGWPKSKSVISNGCTTKTMHDPIMVKPKCVWEAVVNQEREIESHYPLKREI